MSTSQQPRRLHEILAIAKGVKSTANQALTAAYHQIQKAPLMSGLSRTYQPLNDEGERFPSESQRVQVSVGDLLDQVRDSLIRMFDVELTVDLGNTIARADVIVDGTTLATGLPVSYLLFLEKQLTDLGTFIGKLPVLDAAEVWSWDDNTSTYTTTPVQTVKSKKVPRNHVKAEATDKHPAQVEVYFEDVLVGNWTTVKFSGALPQARINTLKARVHALQEAVKQARERANATVVEDQAAGAALFGYLLAP